MYDILKRAKELETKVNGPSISELRGKLNSFKEELDVTKKFGQIPRRPLKSLFGYDSHTEIVSKKPLQSWHAEMFDFGKEINESATPRISVVDPPTFRYISDPDLFDKVDELIKKEESFLPTQNLEDDGFDWN
jgi:hypothetical protein